jgi:hypothetical protein
VSVQPFLLLWLEPDTDFLAFPLPPPRSLLPETKGVPLEKMDELFSIRPVRLAGPILMDELHRNKDNRIATLGRTASSAAGDSTPEKDARGSLNLHNSAA